MPKLSPAETDEIIAEIAEQIASNKWTATSTGEVARRHGVSRETAQEWARLARGLIRRSFSETQREELLAVLVTSLEDIRTRALSHGYEYCNSEGRKGYRAAPQFRVALEATLGVAELTGLISSKYGSTVIQIGSDPAAMNVPQLKAHIAKLEAEAKEIEAANPTRWLEPAPPAEPPPPAPKVFAPLPADEDDELEADPHIRATIAAAYADEGGTAVD